MQCTDDARPFQLEGRKTAGSGRKILYNKTNNRWEFRHCPRLFYGTSDPTEPDQLVPYRMISERGRRTRSAGRLGCPSQLNAVFVGRLVGGRG